MTSLTRTCAGLAVTAATLACAAPAVAQQPALTPNTITVTGTGEVAPNPANRKSNASILAAVERAKQAAIPRAIADGRARAANLAALSGLTLGPLLALAEAQSPTGYFGPFGPFSQEGTFGPDKYCGTVTRAIFVTTKAGKRKRVGVRRFQTCRVPDEVYASLTMTFGVVVT